MLDSHCRIRVIGADQQDAMRRARDCAVALCCEPGDDENALHVREARHCDVIEYAAGTVARGDPTRTVMELGMEQWLDGLEDFRHPLVGRVRVIIVVNAGAMTGAEEGLLNRALDICDGKLVAIRAVW